jgi:Xaa-Pro aminopeptidase
LIDSRCSQALKEAFGNFPIEEGDSIIQHAKSIKNEVELEGFRSSHKRDAIALVSFY